MGTSYLIVTGLIGGFTVTGFMMLIVGAIFWRNLPANARALRVATAGYLIGATLMAFGTMDGGYFKLIMYFAFVPGAVACGFLYRRNIRDVNANRYDSRSTFE